MHLLFVSSFLRICVIFSGHIPMIFKLSSMLQETTYFLRPAQKKPAHNNAAPGGSAIRINAWQKTKAANNKMNPWQVGGVQLISHYSKLKVFTRYSKWCNDCENLPLVHKSGWFQPMPRTCKLNFKAISSGVVTIKKFLSSEAEMMFLSKTGLFLIARFFYKRVPIYRQPEEQILLINEEVSLQNHDASFKKKTQESYYDFKW